MANGLESSTGNEHAAGHVRPTQRKHTHYVTLHHTAHASMLGTLMGGSFKKTLQWLSAEKARGCDEAGPSRLAWQLAQRPLCGSQRSSLIAQATEAFKQTAEARPFPTIMLRFRQRSICKALVERSSHQRRPASPRVTCIPRASLKQARKRTGHHHFRLWDLLKHGLAASGSSPVELGALLLQTRPTAARPCKTGCRSSARPSSISAP